MELQRYIKHSQKRVNTALAKLLPNPNKEPRELYKAMRYSVLNGGKRIRSALVYATGDALGANPKVLDRVSAAIEMIHAFSLIHDDLPALDNDDLRRGKPSCHKAYGEATAILAGDALHTLAFEVLTDISPKLLPPAMTLRMIHLFADAIGPTGLAGGQALDIAMVNEKVTIKALATTYKLKTGNFITTSILMGALAARCQRKSVLDNLKKFGDAIGLAFQIHDDIIGVETDTQTLGKPQGSDVSRNKPTYPSLLGLDAAKKIEKNTFNQAIRYLTKTRMDYEQLAAIAAYVIERDY